MVLPLPTMTAPSAPAALIFLRQSLVRALTQEGRSWLDAEVERQKTGVDERKLVMALGMAGRKVGRKEWALSDDEQRAARALRSGWQPEAWGTDEAARAMLLLATYRNDDTVFAARVDRLCANAEVTELIAYLKAFAILPAPALLHDRAREGVRSSVKPVFEAIACRNPYPFDHFDEAAWNQMVVKAVFVGASIRDIVGISERANPELRQMLRALISERRAAGRAVPAEVAHYVK